MSTPDAVLLLHGAWMNQLVMAYLGYMLRGEGFAAQALTYHTMRETLEEHLAQVAKRVVSLDARRVHLVGHSLGGVIALRYLQRAPDERVRRVVLIGAPVAGCRAAMEFSRSSAGKVVLGRSLGLWSGPIDVSLGAGFEVGGIAGTRSIGLGRIFAQLPTPNDGVVCLDETKLPAMRDHIVLPVAHSEMLVSPSVGRQVAAFLKTGAFRR